MAPKIELRLTCLAQLSGYEKFGGFFFYFYFLKGAISLRRFTPKSELC